ncbi:MAG: hypothetical protein JWM52_550 [Candidatus Saccharibacteria bacterium]|nr:hypothetical protein [Candidatus Saccharibacteria bacterium]
MIKSLRTFIKSRHNLRLLVIFGIGVVLFFVLLLITDRRPNSDDIALQSEILPFPHLFDWLNFRYHTWSGRLIPDTFMYIFTQAPIIFWKLTSLLFYILFTAMIFSYYVLFSHKRTPVKDYTMLAGAILLPFLMDIGAYVDGTLWITGAMNYFWITAIALVAFFPVAYLVVHNKIPHWAISVVGIIASIIAAVSQEQLGLVLAVLVTILTVYYCVHTRRSLSKKHVLYLTAFTLVLVVAVLVNVLAPGNELRIQAETLARLPTFNSVPLLERFDYSLRWLLDRLINHASFFLSVISAILALLFVAKRNKTKLDYVYTSILAVSSFALFMKGSEIISYWFNFYPTWQHEILPVASYLMLIPWIIVIFIVATAPLILAPKKRFYLFVALIIWAAFASLALITLSPTMYASGLRVVYVPSMLLFFAAFLLIDKLFETREKLVIIGLIFAFVLFASQYLQVILKTLF